MHVHVCEHTHTYSCVYPHARLLYVRLHDYMQCTCICVMCRCAPICRCLYACVGTHACFVSKWLMYMRLRVCLIVGMYVCVLIGVCLISVYGHFWIVSSNHWEKMTWAVIDNNTGRHTHAQTYTHACMHRDIQRIWTGWAVETIVQVAQSLHAPFCCPSSAGVAAAVMSACSRGSSSLATCFGHRFALDGIEKCSAMGRMGTACRNTTTE